MKDLFFIFLDTEIENKTNNMNRLYKTIYYVQLAYIILVGSTGHCSSRPQKIPKREAADSLWHFRRHGV